LIGPGSILIADYCEYYNFFRTILNLISMDKDNHKDLDYKTQKPYLWWKLDMSSCPLILGNCSLLIVVFSFYASLVTYTLCMWAGYFHFS